jgi:hypothetical protein
MSKEVPSGRRQRRRPLQEFCVIMFSWPGMKDKEGQIRGGGDGKRLSDSQILMKWRASLGNRPGFTET